MSETNFQVGDKVEAFGMSGAVTSIKPSPDQTKVLVSFDIGRYEWFYLDGRLNSWHKEPSLKLIERPKKKVTKTMYQAICKRSEDQGFYMTDVFFCDQQDALDGVGNDFIALGPAITFEVEE